MAGLVLDFVYTDEESNLIAQAYLEEKPWDVECIHPVKRKIFAYHSARQKELCCYCQRDQYGEFKMVIDTEHVLPKERYRDQMFDIWNLSVSCKRCNMRIKGQRKDFLPDPEFKAISKVVPDAYLFVHPNLDKASEHLTRLAAQAGNNRLVKYVIKPGSQKGAYTYAYFQLKDLEIDSFDDVQKAKPLQVQSDSLEFFRDLVKRAGG